MVRASVSTSWAAARGLVGLSADPLVEAASLHELQRKKGPTFVLAGLVNLHDVGMKQLGNGFRLGAKPRQADLTNMCSRQDHLQGDQALQPTVPGLVDDAHAAPAEFFQDVVTRHGHALQSACSRRQASRGVTRRGCGLRVGCARLPGVLPRQQAARFARVALCRGDPDLARTAESETVVLGDRGRQKNRRIAR